jgi:hypothetical protein
MIVTGLLELGEDPSFVNGGVIADLGVSSARATPSCSSSRPTSPDGSFLLYDTSIALITNVDPDHLDHYGSRDAFEQAFVDFADRARELVVISSDDAGRRACRERLSHGTSSRSARRRMPRCACTPSRPTVPWPSRSTTSGATYRAPAHPRTPQRASTRRRVRRARRPRPRPGAVARGHRDASPAPAGASSCTAPSAA